MDDLNFNSFWEEYFWQNWPLHNVIFLPYPAYIDRRFI